jgi:hypothetical protein
MRRRDFVAGFGLGPYALVVLADQLPPGRQLPPSEIGQALEALAPAAARPGAIPAETHMRLVELNTDVLVAGGGLAGVCAAIAAARHGARVVLVQDRSRLGGNSSSEVKMHVVGSSCHKGRPGWRESGLIEEFRLDDAVNNPQRSFELWDLLLYDKVVSEPNITLLLDSVLYAANMESGRIQSAMVRCDATEHLYRIRAPIFVDCTGDSRLGLEAGAEMRVGREARAEFGESLAPERGDDLTLGSSILFTSRDYRKPMPFTPPRWARKVTREHVRMRRINSWEYGYWWIAWGGDHDTIHHQQRIRFELLSIVLGVWDYIKNSGDHPSSATWAMDWVGFLPGKRGSRRLVGDHLLTQHDLERGDIEDAVAIGGWPMDDHPPEGFDRADLAPNRAIRTAEVYNIPLRCLYSRNVPNLMMAGRNISCSHVAFTSTRVMGTCAVAGQAVGTAAALCVREGTDPRRIYEDKKLLAKLQQELLRDDQTIKNRTNNDPRDLARQARVAASDQHAAAPAECVLDGHLRDYPAKGGKEIHHWAARMRDGGVWLELSWDQARRIREVQITFDSGFERELTLTASDSINRGIIRAAQPETARDYAVTARRPGKTEHETLAAVTANHQRLRRHRFEPVEAEALRIHITATNGDDYARVFEVRCYG